MQLVFGTATDGRVYPDFPGAWGGALDDAVVGPAGLVEALEAQLGLLGPAPPKAVRIAAFLAKLRAAGPGRFWSASFDKDPWSTASMLLGWRDTLVAAGWTAAPVGLARPDDLAAAERAGAPLPRGLADRLVAVSAVLPDRPGLRLSRLTLLEPRARLAPPWRRLVDTLQASGVTIVEPAGAAAAAGPASDLTRVQAALRGAPAEALTGDGSFAVVEADTALMAAEAVADWLAAGPPEELAGTLILAPDGDTALLDRALVARGLPACGLSKASPWRGALQILPLAFAVAWSPFDPKALLSLLMLPRPPIGRFAASRLARALVEEPGLDGRAWARAWTDIEAHLLANEPAEDPAEAARSVARRLAQWRAWTAGGQIARAAGMTVADARAIAGRVSAWALEQDAGAGDRLLWAVAGAAGAFVRAVESLEQPHLPALLVERILGQVLADGVSNPDHVAHAGGLRAVQAPGALWGPVPRLIWWSFVGPGEAAPATPWDAAETAALAAAGVRLEPPAEAALRISAGYADVLQQVRARTLLVRPALSGADQTVAHPLAHQLYPLTSAAGDRIRWRAERLLEAPHTDLAGRELQRAPVELIDPPLGRARWDVPAAAAALMAGRRESATTLGRLLNCQLSWLAQDVLRLRAGRFAEIPGADQLFGNLAHEIASRLLPPGPPPPRADIRVRALALFDDLLPRMAAPLQRPELAGELAAARARVPAALEALVGLLHARGLEVVGAELDREGAAGALDLQGRLDLLVRQGEQPAVLDLKWTRSVRRYRDEVADGRAVQLAVYGAIADPRAPAPGGYFLLRQGRLLAERGSILADEDIETSRGQDETLRAVVEDWDLWRGLAAAGDVIAAGVGDAASLRPDGLAFPAPDQPCRFCGLTGLCRVGVETV